MKVSEMVTQMTGNMDGLQVSVGKCIFASALYAAAATIFYKKSFEKHMIRTLFFILVSAFIFERLNTEQMNTVSSVSRFIIASTTAAVIGVPSVLWDKRQAKMKTYSPATFGTFFLAILDFKLDVLVSFFNLPIWTTFLVNFLVTVPQFIRAKPWKSRLQQVRANLGPVYIIYAIKTATIIYGHDRYIGMMAFASAFTAALAGTLFRPDNAALLSIIKPGTTLAERRTIHRALMLFSSVWWLFGMQWYSCS